MRAHRRSARLLLLLIAFLAPLMEGQEPFDPVVIFRAEATAERRDSAPEPPSDAP